MRKLVRTVLDVHEGEGRRVFLMWTYIFAVITSLLMIKPVASSMFLSEFGAAQLPFAHLLVALTAAAAAAILIRVLDQVRIDRIISRSLLMAIAVLATFWAAHFFRALDGWLLYALYAFVAVWAAISASQFWILANLIFNAREAKRLFGLIGAGAITGGVVGGYSTNLLAPVIGSENLLAVAALVLATCLPIVSMLWADNERTPANARHQQRRVMRRPYQSTARLVASSRHLRLIALLVGLGVVVAKVIEYQFGAVAAAAIPGDDDLTAFFGFWLSTINLVSLLVQVLLTRRVIAWLGVGRSLYVLPASLFAASWVFFMAPALAAVVLVRMTDGSLKPSINKAGMELLYLPIASAVKGQAKLFIDVFVDSLATGFGGLVLLAATFGAGLTPRGLAILSAGLAATWIALVRQVRREYIESFRLRIETRTGDDADATVLPVSSTMATLVEALTSPRDDEVLAALEALPSVRNRPLREAIVGLLAHDNPGIRAAALRELCLSFDVDLSSRARELIADADLEVRSEAIAYLFERAPARVEELRTFLVHDSLDVRAAALICAAREARTNRRMRNALELPGSVEALMRAIPTVPSADSRNVLKVACARAIGEAELRAQYSYLHVFLTDPSAVVVRAALRGAARSMDTQFIQPIVHHLGTDAARDEAVVALAELGEIAFPVLLDRLHDPQTSEAEQLGVLRALGAIGSQDSVDLLFRVLREGDYALRSEATRGLNRLRRDNPLLRFDEQQTERRILDESDDYLQTLTGLYAHQRTNGEGSTAQAAESAAHAELVRLLESRLDENLERIFRLLGLNYPPDEIHDAFVGLQSGQPQDLRASAVEFLDNVLEPNLKRIIIPLVETTFADALPEHLFADLRIRIPTEIECLRRLLAARDGALVVAALRLIVLRRDSAYVREIAELVASSDPAVRLAAREALENFGYLDQRTD